MHRERERERKKEKTREKKRKRKETKSKQLISPYPPFLSISLSETVYSSIYVVVNGYRHNLSEICENISLQAFFAQLVFPLKLIVSF